MEYDKINNLLRSEELGSVVDRFKSIRFKTPMLRSDLCDYADAYILVEGIIIVDGNAPRDRQNRLVILKNNAPFISFITRINGELIEDADDLDVDDYV